MSCCLEQAIVTQLKNISCTPIRVENHFIGQKQCVDCVPYLVLKCSEIQGIRTSDTVTEIHTIDISAYFPENMYSVVADYREKLREFVLVPDCISLAECGCFCVNRLQRISIVVVAGGLLRLQCLFSGRYNALSGAASESS